jgi:hypothetical protein
MKTTFASAILLLDPNNLLAVLRESPFHVDSLLQLSEVSKHNGDVALAGEFIGMKVSLTSFLFMSKNRPPELTIYTPINWMFIQSKLCTPLKRVSTVFSSSARVLCA